MRLNRLSVPIQFLAYECGADGHFTLQVKRWLIALGVQDVFEVTLLGEPLYQRSCYPCSRWLWYWLNSNIRKVRYDLVAYTAESNSLIR